MLGPTKEMFDIMPAMGNKTEVNQILNGQDSAFFYGCTAPSTVSSLTQKKKKRKIPERRVNKLKVRFYFLLRSSLRASDLKSLFKNTKQEVLHEKR